MQNIYCYAAEKHSDASCLHRLPSIAFQKEKKPEIQGNSALEETGKGAAGVNVANVAVGDTDILFPLNMSAEKYLR